MKFGRGGPQDKSGLTDRHSARRIFATERVSVAARARETA